MSANKSFARSLHLTQAPHNLSRRAPVLTTYVKKVRWYEKKPPVWAQALFVYAVYLMFGA